MIQRGAITPPTPWPLPLCPALCSSPSPAPFFSCFGLQTLPLFSFGRKLKNCRCIEPAACRRLSGTPPSACKKAKWGFLERSYLSSLTAASSKTSFCLHHQSSGASEESLFSLLVFFVCVFPVKALFPLFLPFPSLFLPSASSLLLPCATSPRALSCVPYF